MKKCILIPDSFKGTLASIEVCDIMERKVKEKFPCCEVHKIPVADGGEGTLECFVEAKNAEYVKVWAHNAYMEQIETCYVRVGAIAIIEVARLIGLPMVNERKNPEITTTYGVGELIYHAVEHGCNEIIIGLGGSCTNDAGTGMAAALGTSFRGRDGKNYIPTGGTLGNIEKIDCSKTWELLAGIQVIAMCDVNNPLYGEDGAAHVFAPQKGADELMVKRLDDQLRYLSEKIKEDLHMEVGELEGGGAAGGMGCGVIAFLKGQLKSGINTVLDMVDFDRLLNGTDFIFTGEGQFDYQSLNGKVICGVAERAKKKQVPVIVIAGSIGEKIDNAYEQGISAIFSINQRAEDFSISAGKSKINLENTMENLLRMMQVVESMEER